MNKVFLSVLSSCVDIWLVAFFITLTIDLIFTLCDNKKYHSTITFIYDVIFFITHTLAFIIFTYYFNSGRLRWFFVLFDMCGISVYYFFVSKIIRKISTLIRKLISTIMHPIIKVVRKLIIFPQAIAKKK